MLVLDASTAILLAKIDLLRLVTEKTECWMGDVAGREALAKTSDDAVAIATLVEAGRIRKSAGAGDAAKLMRDFRLHVGEAEAVLLARKKGAVCGTDDGRAIRCCKVLGVRFTTAIALLVAFTETGHVSSPEATELLAKLERFGRYHSRIMDDAAARIRAAKKTGESS